MAWCVFEKRDGWGVGSGLVNFRCKKASSQVSPLLFLKLGSLGSSLLWSAKGTNARVSEIQKEENIVNTINWSCDEWMSNYQIQSLRKTQLEQTFPICLKYKVALQYCSLPLNKKSILDLLEPVE